MTDEQVKYIGDAGAIAVAGAAWLAWLPHIAAVLSIIWVAIRIYETDTVKGIVKWLRGETPAR